MTDLTANHVYTVADSRLGPQVTLWQRLDRPRWWRRGLRRTYRKVETHYWFPQFDPTPEDCARTMLRERVKRNTERAEYQRIRDAYREPKPIYLESPKR